VLLSMLLAALDQSIVAPAMPTIARELGHEQYLPWIVTGYLLTLAVDTPFHPKSFAAIARERLDQGALAAIASYNGQAYPTNALWRLAVLADLPRRALAGKAPKSIMALAGELGAVHLDWSEEAGGDPFDNANTVFELMNLERRAIRNFGLGKAKQTR
jgi:molybdopterin-guanine dinucleotide biosynthesis protein A